MHEGLDKTKFICRKFISFQERTFGKEYFKINLIIAYRHLRNIQVADLEGFFRVVNFKINHWFTFYILFLSLSLAVFEVINNLFFNSKISLSDFIYFLDLVIHFLEQDAPMINLEIFVFLANDSSLFKYVRIFKVLSICKLKVCFYIIIL